MNTIIFKSGALFFLLKKGNSFLQHIRTGIFLSFCFKPYRIIQIRQAGIVLNQVLAPLSIMPPPKLASFYFTTHGNQSFAFVHWSSIFGQEFKLLPLVIFFSKVHYISSLYCCLFCDHFVYPLSRPFKKGGAVVIVTFSTLQIMFWLGLGNLL